MALIEGAEEPDGGPTLADISTQWDELPATLDARLERLSELGWIISGQALSRAEPQPWRYRRGPIAPPMD